MNYEIMKIDASANYFNVVLLLKVNVLQGAWGLTLNGGLTVETLQYWILPD